MREDFTSLKKGRFNHICKMKRGYWGKRHWKCRNIYLASSLCLVSILWGHRKEVRTPFAGLAKTLTKMWHLSCVFKSFPGGSAGKASAFNAEDLGLIPGLGRFPRRRERLPTPVFWPGGFHGLYSTWGRIGLDTFFHFSKAGRKITRKKKREDDRYKKAWEKSMREQSRRMKETG